MASENEEKIALPPDTLQILKEFLREKAEQERQEQEQILEKSGKNAHFEEDWVQLSQFWYDEETKNKLGAAVKKLISTKIDCLIGLLSCPSLYNTIKSFHENVRLFEYDQRFAAFGDDFIFYDFNDAFTSAYLSEYQHKFDIIIVDPPFLSEECISKISTITRKLLKSDGRIIFCSGETVAGWVTKSLNLKQQEFRPKHERNLGNEFASYSSFNLDEIIE